MIFEGTCVESPRRFAAHAPSGTIFHLWRLAIACAASSMSGLSRSEEHTSELQSRLHLVCRLLLEKKKHTSTRIAVEIRDCVGLELWVYHDDHGADLERP